MDKDPYIYRIKSVLKVVDGDTIDAAIDLGFSISLEKRIRLAGVDTPESRTTDAKEKALGLEVKEWLKKKLEGQLTLLSKQNSQILPKSTEEFLDICLLGMLKYPQSIKRNPSISK